MLIKKFVEGLQIIMAYEPETSCDIHDDKLFAGTYGAVTKPDDVARLKRLGWREREGSWCIGT